MLVVLSVWKSKARESVPLTRTGANLTLRQSKRLPNLNPNTMLLLNATLSTRNSFPWTDLDYCFKLSLGPTLIFFQFEAQS